MDFSIHYCCLIPFLFLLEGVSFRIITTILASLVLAVMLIERTGEGIGYFAMASSLEASFASVQLDLFYSKYLSKTNRRKENP